MDRVGELKGRRILLLDPVLATAATVIMAVRVLLDHGAEEESITFTPLFSSPEGICNLSYAFSKVTVVTSAVDDGLSDAGYLLPGVGNFGDRYFGTD
jgi:uracil phosphoribosyltransferase